VNPFPTNTTPREISQPKHLTGFEIGVCANIVQRAFEAHGSRTGERAPEELWGMFSKYVFQDNWTTNQLPPAIDSSIWPDFRPIRVSRRAGLGNLGYGRLLPTSLLSMLWILPAERRLSLSVTPRAWDDQRISGHGARV
jgi:hypothetical protein